VLVLSRKLGEKIFIGDDVTITVVDIDRGKIRLGIEAPRDLPIYRQELLPHDQGPASVNGRRKSLDEANRRVAELEALLAERLTAAMAEGGSGAK
jgi:carbon storage regulator